MTKQTDLSAELSRFQLVLEEHAPATASGLASAALPGAIDNLRRVLGLDSIPRDLAALYGWHDGQLPGAPPIQGNRVLLSVEAAIGAWRFLNDPLEDHPNPVDRRWLPILYNGAGDYVVYDTASHQLLEYRHDESSTNVTWPSIAAWVASAIAQISTTAAGAHDDALRLLARDPARFVAIVRADATSINLTTLRELRDTLQIPLVELKRLIAQPTTPLVSARLGDTASRRSIRNVILLLDKNGCAPRVALARDNEDPVETSAAVFLSALPL